MNTTRKKLISILSLFMIFSCGIIPVNAENPDKENEKAGIQIAEYLEDLNISEKSNYSIKDGSEFYNTYAGAWIDKDNNPHVAFTHDQKERKNIMGVNDITITYFDHSLNDLLELQESISLDQSMDIISIAVLEDKNALKVGYSKNENLSNIVEKIETLNTKNIKIIYEEVDNINEDAIYGGSAISASGYGGCSVGFSARLNGNYGFVTAGHCYPVGTQTNLGKVTRRVYAGNTNMDAEFIQSGMILKTDLSGNSYSSVGEYGVYQGSYVRINTHIQKSSGTIQSMFAVADFGSYSINNLIQHNAYRVGGMSGGVAISGSQAVGIHIGGRGNLVTTGYIVKGSAVKSSLGIFE